MNSHISLSSKFEGFKTETVKINEYSMVESKVIKSNLRKWQPTPLLLPGKFHGWQNRVGYSPWVCKELDITE